MAALAELVAQIFARLGGLLVQTAAISQEIQAIKSLVGGTSETHTTDDIYTLLTRVYTGIFAPVTGIDSRISRVQTGVSTIQGDLGPNLLATEPFTGQTYSFLLAMAGSFASNMGNAAIRFQVSENPILKASTDWRVWAVGPYVTGVPIDLGTILPTDATVLAWLTRAYPAYPWADGGDGYVHYSPPYPFPYYIDYLVDLTQAQFDSLRVKSHSAPIWPGIANVTVGSPVAITPEMTIVGPMDGVIVNLSSIDAGTMFFTFDDVRSYRAIGQLSFYNDNGNQGERQTLGFTSGFYLPADQVRAAGVKLYFQHVASGTVTPFTIP